MPAFFKNIKKQYYIAFLISSSIYAFSFLCLSFNTPKYIAKQANIVDTLFAGSASCKSCHHDIYQTHVLTAHYRTSSLADSYSIKGSFDPKKNRFRYSKFMEVVMEEKADSFFQAGYISGAEYQREPFDIVIGSGRKGQTYLYWNANNLFQLPVSYYVPAESWCNSPGYPTSMIYFDRFIQARCIECHGTYANTIEQGNAPTIFDRNSIIYGVDCERCHGPSAKHVLYHTQNPNEKIGKFIINAKKLTRQQRMDACALCHSGFRKEIKPAFSFVVGDKLSDYSLPNYNTDSSSWLDVHGNQYGLLTSSKCFTSSDKMDCSSCHNVHKVEINDPKLYATRCMNCHSEATHDFCSMPEVKALKLNDNCINCHMPLLPSKKIFLQMQNKQEMTADLVRTHRVAIYPEKAKEFIRSLKKK